MIKFSHYNVVVTFLIMMLQVAIKTNFMQIRQYTQMSFTWSTSLE